MSFLIVCPGKNPQKWVEELQNQHPGLNIYVYPEEHDKEEVEFALVWNHPRGLFKNYPNLKVVASMGAGVDHITADPELPEDIKITKVVDEQLTKDMSAFVLGLVMDHILNLPFYRLQETRQEWTPVDYKRTRDVKIGVMGMGVLGTAVAKNLDYLGFPVTGWAKTSKDIDGIKTFFGDEGKDEFLAQTEILICLLPLTPATEGILNKELFEKLPEKAYIINVARGEHLVEHDLLEMVNSGHLSGAALDVFREEPLPKEHPFWEHHKIQITPHVASVTRPESVVPQIVDNYERMKEEEPLQNLVEKKKGY